MRIHNLGFGMVEMSDFTKHILETARIQANAHRMFPLDESIEHDRDQARFFDDLSEPCQFPGCKSNADSECMSCGAPTCDRHENRHCEPGR